MLCKKHGHPSRRLSDMLTPYTVTVDSHPIKLWENRNTPTQNNKLGPYKNEALFLTASNGDIVVRTDGEAYDVEID